MLPTLWRRAAASLDLEATDIGPLLRVENRRTHETFSILGLMVTGESLLAYGVCGDKTLTFRLLREAGVSVPAGKTFGAGEESAAVDYAQSMQQPCVVKPARRTGGGLAVAVRLTSARQVRRAFRAAALFCDEVVIEQFIPGENYRCLVYKGKCLSVLWRKLPGVVGNGTDTVRELARRENETRIRDLSTTGEMRLLMTLPMGRHGTQVLAMQGLGWRSVPEQGREVQLSLLSNFQFGTTYLECLDETNPEILAAVERAAQVTGAALAGVDVISPDLRSPRHHVNEVNTTPGLLTHYAVDNAGKDPLRSILAAELCGLDLA
jgi:cyanophycin synthetase